MVGSPCVARLVVAAVIQRDGRFLVAQRPPTKHYPLQWEFPGGKIEPGEAPEAALRREIREELGVDVRVGRVLERIRHDYGDGHDYELLFFECELGAGEPSPQSGQGVHRIEWMGREELQGLDFLEGNRPLVARLSRRP
jgi:8-oxo-dGTP diphosphatase